MSARDRVDALKFERWLVWRNLPSRSFRITVILHLSLNTYRAAAQANCQQGSERARLTNLPKALQSQVTHLLEFAPAILSRVIADHSIIKNDA